jgi:hypothetical protein|tara:strand:+ start:214 stop:495 length:282 start_codon:yes stop_codon:yes gene_type:complete
MSFYFVGLWKILQLGKAIHKLEQLDLAKIETVPHYRVTIASRTTPKTRGRLKRKPSEEKVRLLRQKQVGPVGIRSNAVLTLVPEVVDNETNQE